MGPQRTPAPGLGAAAAVLGLLVGAAAAAAPHFDCRPGAVAFETVSLPDRTVVLLSRGPGCPLLAPRPPLPASVASEGAAGAGAPTLVDDDAPGGAFLSPASALHSSSPQGHSAGQERRPALTSAAAIGGVLMLVLLVVAISHTVWDRNVRQPKLLAQKAAEEEEAEAARLASEEAELRARQKLEEMAHREADRRAREEAEKKAREEAEKALAERLLQEQATEAAKTRGSKGQYDDHKHAFQLDSGSPLRAPPDWWRFRRSSQEEEERRQHQERDALHKAEQPARKTEPEKKKSRCGPCGCSSGKGVSEPGHK